MGYLFGFVEFDAIRAYFEFMNFEVQSVYRNTTKADILKAYNAERLKIKALLEEVPSRICFTSNLWTACTADGYMTLTTHFIDKNWVLQKRFYCTLFIRKVIIFMDSMGLEKNFFSITLDNAS